ncbi:MAG: hypothetical protein OCC46_03250 [Pseudodesulfovibrio sp.]
MQILYALFVVLLSVSLAACQSQSQSAEDVGVILAGGATLLSQ